MQKDNYDNIGSDLLHRFVLEQSSVRGFIVQLTSTWQHVVSRKSYPQNIGSLLGQSLAAIAMLSSDLKQSEKLSLQAKGQGDLSLLIAEANGLGGMRAIAKYNQNIAEISEKHFNQLIPGGQLIVSYESEQGKKSQQSIITVDEENLALNLENYFKRSVQLPAKIHLLQNSARAAGIMLQNMPESDTSFATNPSEFYRLAEKLQVITEYDLLHLNPNQLLLNVFGENSVRVFEPREVYFSCSCNRERVARMLTVLPKNELLDLLTKQEVIEIECEFCYTKYQFDKVDTEYLIKTHDAGEIMPTDQNN